MARLTPFSYSFSTTHGSNGTETYELTGSELKSFTAYVETNNLGPILVDVHLLIENAAWKNRRKNFLFLKKIYSACSRYIKDFLNDFQGG